MASDRMDDSRLQLAFGTTDGPAPDSHGDRSDSDRGNSKEPGDAYVIACAVLGIAIGGAVGLWVSRDIGGLFIAVLCAAGGALLGGSVGALLGEKLKARIVKRKGSRSDPE